MKTIKYAFAIAAVFLAGVILALLIIPSLFKENIISYIKNDINKEITAIIDVDDVHLSMISSFPDLRITFDSLSVTGTQEFEGIPLYQADKTYIDLDLLSVLQKKKTPTINFVRLDNPVIHILSYNDTLSNYDIMPSSSSDTSAFNFELAISNYTLNNAHIRYQDYALGVDLVMDELNHDGTGDFTQDVFDLKTRSRAGKLSFTFDDMTYLHEVSAELAADLHLDFLQNKFTLKDNKLTLNEFALRGDGFVQLEGDDITMEALLKSESQDFRSFLSLLPEVYLQDLKNITTRGEASVEAMIKGVYNAVNGSMPGFDVKVRISDGYLRFPSLSDDINNISADIRVKALRPDHKDMSIQVPVFQLFFGKESLSGKLMVENLTGQQNIEGALKADVNLGHFKNILPLKDVEKIGGLIKSDLSFKARMPDINSENYQNIDFKGDASITDFTYKATNEPLVFISQVQAAASPSKLSLTAEKMQLGKSDVSLTGDILNPLAFVSTQKNITVHLTGNSHYLDLNEWSSEEKADSSVPQTYAEPDKDISEILDQSNLNIQWVSDKIIWDTYQIDDLTLKGALAKNSILIDDFRAVLEGNDIRIKGIVTDAYDYLFNGGILSGEIDLYSKNMDLDRFMTLMPGDSEATTPMSVIPVPSHLNVMVHGQIDRLIYRQMLLTGFEGRMSIKDETLSIEDMSTSALGGQIKMQGLYSTENEGHPDFNLKLDLNHIKFLDAFQTFDLVKIAAPVSQYIKGLFNTTLVMQGKLGDQMIPDFSSLDASGYLETLHGTLSEFEPLQKASTLLGINELKNLDFSQTKNGFEINNGTVELKPFEKNIKGMDFRISGFHGLNKDMSYTMNLNIPREILKESPLGKSGVTGLAFLEEEAQKLGLPFKQTSHFKVDILIGGTLKNPTVKIVPRASEETHLKDVVSQQIETTKAQIKDTIRKEVEKRSEKIKDTIIKRTEKELDIATDSIITIVKREVYSRADSLSRGWIEDSLTNNVKDMLDNKAKDEIENIKNKLKDFNPLKRKGQ